MRWDFVLLGLGDSRDGCRDGRLYIFYRGLSGNGWDVRSSLDVQNYHYVGIAPIGDVFWEDAARKGAQPLLVLEILRVVLRKLMRPASC